MRTLTALFILLATQAHAQSNCAPRDAIVSQLVDKFGEITIGGGLQSETRLYEFWVSRETGTWSVIVSHANGMTCVLATGNNWVTNPEFLRPMGDDM